jgi:hypothetical protein
LEEELSKLDDEAEDERGKKAAESPEDDTPDKELPPKQS